jgi:hypothetical protein
MAVYKIPQDVEAEDKFIGPFSFKQSIYFGIVLVSAYLIFWLTQRGFWPSIPILLPFVVIFSFLSWPWSKVQSNEVWLAAKIRFYIKPRLRIWNQSGLKQLLDITAPIRDTSALTDGLNEGQVQSRLGALASVLDSRGWAIKNANLSSFTPTVVTAPRMPDDRLVAPISLPTAPIQMTDIKPADDMMDVSNNPTAAHMDNMVNQATLDNHTQLRQRMDNITAGKPVETAATPKSFQAAEAWFQANSNILPDAPVVASTTPAIQQQFGHNTVVGNGQAMMPQHPDGPSYIAPSAQPDTQYGYAVSPVAPSVVGPTELDEKALLDRVHAQAEAKSSAGLSTRLKTILPQSSSAVPVTKSMTGAIITYASNDDLSVETIARQVSQEKRQSTLKAQEIIINNNR